MMILLFIYTLLSSVVFGQKTAKQPNCEELKGLQIDDLSTDAWFGGWPPAPNQQYNGVLKECKKGKIIEYVTCKNGKSDGIHKRWNKIGKLSLIDWSTNGDLDSSIYYYYSKNGNLNRKGIYKKNGAFESKIYDHNGKLKVHLELKESDSGFLIGIKKEYSNGILQIEYHNLNKKRGLKSDDLGYGLITYKRNDDDQVIDIFVTSNVVWDETIEQHFYDNGQLKLKLTFKNGIQTSAKKYDKKD